jgi:hypothetical protein
LLRIGAVLHFNNHEDAVGMQSDEVHKVLPILNIIMSKLGKYDVLGSERSFDRATMVCCFSYGRHLCCASLNLTNNFKIQTTDNSDREEQLKNNV